MTGTHGRQTRSVTRPADPQSADVRIPERSRRKAGSVSGKARRRMPDRAADPKGCAADRRKTGAERNHTGAQAAGVGAFF